MYLTPNSDFLANLNALIQASTDLFGAGSAQTAAIRKSQAAVGIANSPTVTFPNGGESLTAGTPQTITWTSPGDAGIGYQVDVLRDLGAITNIQNFEGELEPAAGLFYGQRAPALGHRHGQLGTRGRSTATRGRAPSRTDSVRFSPSPRP